MNENQDSGEYIFHKGLINVSDTIIYIIGWIVLLIGFGIDVIGVNKHSASIVGLGIAINWIGILLGLFSGIIGNRKIPEGYIEK
ncbi:hypothetical protein BFU36_00685 [Sulfolobus sp. A20]|uniref:hypothetical protein n=1 Tax=Sulfolobaceae TaxID=118883 RepID=UPI000845FB79|nr:MULTISPECIES: hypothetical protein [unclassified Sulfolobus]TRM74241.1 hypothetical protein DJ532_13345 [Sulfolobus sp. A20-N-F8]TRM76295.1 hypothetical protein DJ523_01330 [Sulfolobus sp. E5]TRM80788.1 hypothetical protein DJ524_06370 [Sulfolobus sp. D5]TRM84029.1 hypothetical protein DJ531_02600 [Sulfolobus sp. A20-N-F6]TRM84984.1 hypothetical protein DJ522_02520 [Sulfolobus sp. F3]TRM85307.1 hypothetical protein DJ526_11395 [Sulfolobus sp. A20-N-G8]TRM88573.1 hypothetical protein DJ529